MEVFLMAIIFGGIICAIAVSRGRNGVAWFFIGFASFLIGLVLVLCLPDLKKERAKHLAQLKKDKRLREQARQDRLKNDSFKEKTERRLDGHDRLLGVKGQSKLSIRSKNKTLQKKLKGSAENNKTPPELPDNITKLNTEDATDSIDWYYVAEEKQEGPVQKKQLVDMLTDGTLPPDTYVWCEELDDWTCANEVDVLIQA